MTRRAQAAKRYPRVALDNEWLIGQVARRIADHEPDASINEIARWTAEELDINPASAAPHGWLNRMVRTIVRAYDE